MVDTPVSINHSNVKEELENWNNFGIIDVL